MATADELARSAAERLSEDESLRGDALTDVGFGPLLNWATDAVTAYASKAKGEADMEKYTDRVRGVVQSVVQVAEAGKLGDPHELLDFDTASKEKLLAGLKALKLGDDPDENATRITAVLQSALTPPAAGESGSTTEAPSTPVPAPVASHPAEGKDPGTPVARASDIRPGESKPAPPFVRRVKTWLGRRSLKN